MLRLRVDPGLAPSNEESDGNGLDTSPMRESSAQPQSESMQGSRSSGSIGYTCVDTHDENERRKIEAEDEGGKKRRTA
jgi:hypothetical protein